MKKLIAFQGELGANSHLACKAVFPNDDVLPCDTFEDAFNAVDEGRADMGMIPVENSIAGRVADIHHLMPASNLHIIGEHFEPVHHQWVAVRGANPAGINSVQSHVMALGQCRNFIRDHKLKAVVGADTAGSAREIAASGDKTRSAIASALAAQIYDLDILARDIEDEIGNTTRFLILSREALSHKPDVPTITTFVFQVRNIPAALYKALGGFATNGINMTKLESYMLGGAFTATQFYADVEGHPNDTALKHALDELKFFCSYFRILGAYPASGFRKK